MRRVKAVPDKTSPVKFWATQEAREASRATEYVIIRTVVSPDGYQQTFSIRVQLDVAVINNSKY